MCCYNLEIFAKLQYLLLKVLPTTYYQTWFRNSCSCSEIKVFSPVLRIRDVYPVSNKILNYLSSEVIKKILVNFQRIIELFVYGPGIRNKPIPDPGSRGQKGTLSRIRIRIKSIRIRIRGEGEGF